MPDSLVMPALLAFVFLPPILVGLLRRTPLFWLPGVGLIALGMYAFATANPDEGHGGPAVMGDGLGAVIGFIPVLYGLICLVVAVAKHAPQPKTAVSSAPPAVKLPPAIVVRDVSKT